MIYYVYLGDNAQYFTHGRRYPVLDWIAGKGILTTDDDNCDHYLSGQYLMEHFAQEENNDTQ